MLTYLGISLTGPLALEDAELSELSTDALGEDGISVEAVFADGAGDDDDGDGLDGANDLKLQLQMDAKHFQHELKKSLPAVQKNIVPTAAETHEVADRDISDDIADAHIVDELRNFAGGADVPYHHAQTFDLVEDLHAFAEKNRWGDGVGQQIASQPAGSDGPIVCLRFKECHFLSWYITVSYYL